RPPNWPWRADTSNWLTTSGSAGNYTKPGGPFATKPRAFYSITYRSAGFSACCIAVLPACEPCEGSCMPGCFRRLADCNSAIRQIENLRYVTSLCIPCALVQLCYLSAGGLFSLKT